MDQFIILKNHEIFKSNICSNPKILIIGGGNNGTAMDTLYYDQSLNLISTDVYPSDKFNLFPIVIIYLLKTIV